MNQFQEEMNEIRESQESARIAEEATARNKQQATAQLEHDIKPLLHSVAHEFIGGDNNLDLQLATDGFTIVYKASSPPLTFAVSATCDGDEVTLNVTDGQWEEVHNFMSNWVNWTDQKAVYSGPLSEQRIRLSLEKQFLSWYKAVVSQSLQ